MDPLHIPNPADIRIGTVEPVEFRPDDLLEATVGHAEGMVFIRFNRPIDLFGLDPQAARRLAEQIRKSSHEAETPAKHVSIPGARPQ